MSTSKSREPRLPPRAEALLKGWPAPARGAFDWEESANGVVAKARDTAIGSTNDDLLGAPLPEEPDEAAHVAAFGESADGDEEPSLAAIARAALSASETERREVARDGLMAAEQGRKEARQAITSDPAIAAASASVAGLQGRVARVSLPEGVAPRAPAKIAAVAMPEPVPAHETAALSERPSPPSPRRGVPPAIFGGTVLALAAAAALYISFTRHSADARAPLTASSETRLSATPHAEPEPPPEPMAVAAASAAPTEVHALDLEQLPAVAEAAKATAALKAPAEKSGLAFHMKGEGKKSKIAVEELAESAPAEKPMAPAPEAKQATQRLAETPSTGAVQAALGSVLTSARSCLAGQDTGTRATLTFDGATGRVKSVQVAGVAAGSPAETCVRGALMGARVQPFSDATFSAGVTVRPL